MTRAITHSIKRYLGELRDTLEASAEPLLAPGEAAALGALVEAHLGDATRFLDGAYARLAEESERLSPEERAGAAALHRLLVQPIFLSSATVRWSVDKPLGYPGDYRMVDRIFDGCPRGGSPLGVLLDAYILGCGPARAHRARQPWALERIRAAAAPADRPLEILSFACGPERVLRDLGGDPTSFGLTLCDFDARALEHAEKRTREAWRRAGRASSKIRSVQLSAFKLIKEPPAAAALLTPEIAQRGGFDAILVLGLLDYLSEPAARAFLDAIVTVLRPGGELLLTNLRAGNPWRAFMEYVGEWEVEHRELGAFTRLAEGNGRLETLDARVDPAAGVNLFYAGRRPAR